MAENTSIEKSNIHDLQFGFQILGDYARFVHNAFSPLQTAELEQAKKFIALFDDLLEKSRQSISGQALVQLNQQAFKDVQDIRKFFLQILKQQISDKSGMNLNPQAVNMMVTTTELLLDGLNAYMHNQYPDTSTLASTWLQNIYITAIIIQDNLGTLYFNERAKAGEFAQIFLQLYNKSQILDGMRRTGLKTFPALNHLHNEIQTHMINYATFLVDLMNFITKKEYIGMISLLHIDSIYRRVCFFMTKLSMVSQIPAPVCDPASPRRE